MTKDQLIKYFSGLDTSLLQRLYKYSQLLIIPEEDLLTNVTMTQMVDKAHSLADVLFPEWTDRSKSDFGEFLVELFAFFSEKDFWYINALANEGLLSKMKSYSNIFSKVTSMGYTPTLCKGSSASFEVTFDKGESATYHKGDLVISVEGRKFTNDDEIVIEDSQDSVVKTITLREGEWVSENVTFNGHCIFIKKGNVDIDSIHVSMNNLDFTRVGNFGESSPEDSHFVVLPEADGSCSIFFGVDGLGLTPDIGASMYVDYRQCSGSEGNISFSKAEVSDSLDDRKCLSATMITDAINGTTAESATSMKEKAPLMYNTGKAAINTKTAKEILESFPFIYQAVATCIGQDVVFCCIPTSGNLELSDAEKEILRNEFTPYVMLGYDVTQNNNEYKDLLMAADATAQAIIVDVIVSMGVNVVDVESRVRQVMSDLTNPLSKAKYGVGFFKSEADLYIRANVRGVLNTSFKLQFPYGEHVMPEVSIGETEIFQPINQDSVIVRVNTY